MSRFRGPGPAAGVKGYVVDIVSIVAGQYTKQYNVDKKGKVSTRYFFDILNADAAPSIQWLKSFPDALPLTPSSECAHNGAVSPARNIAVLEYIPRVQSPRRCCSIPKLVKAVRDARLYLDTSRGFG